jgi:hypothetical protein
MANAIIRGKPAGKGGDRPVSNVGNETKAAIGAAMEGNPTDSNPLRGAVKHLEAQHPHGGGGMGEPQNLQRKTTSPMHMPLHGLRPSR